MFVKAPFLIGLVTALVIIPAAQAFAAQTSMRVLYPSFGGTWATPWIAKEAGYFSAEGLDFELIRVGGSTRMVAAMLGRSAPIIQPGASAASPQPPPEAMSLSSPPPATYRRSV